MSEEPRQEKPLQSWKEIAAYLERDVRTAVRWEKRQGLPIRRHGAGKGSSVYAYPSEIETWRSARPLQVEESGSPFWMWPRTWFAAAALAAATAIVVYGPFLNPEAPTAAAADGAMRAELVPNGVAYPASSISRDGRWMLYPDWSTGNLVIRELATGKDRNLTNKDTRNGDKSMAETSALSPDGRYAAYSWIDAPSNRIQVRSVEVEQKDGQTEPSIVFDSLSRKDYLQVKGWLDSSHVLYLRLAEDRTTSLMIGDRNGGENSTLKSFGWLYPREVTISPDGRWIAYGFEKDVFVIAADGSREVVVTDHPATDTPAFWTPDGSHLVFRSDRTGREDLWALRMEDGNPVGSPKLVYSGVNINHATGVTEEGEFYYLTSSGTVDVFEASIDVSTGQVLEQPTKIDVAVVGRNGAPRYSPDGKSLAYGSRRPRNENVIVVHDLATGAERDLALSTEQQTGLSWAPDSASLLYSSLDPQGRRAIYSVPAAGGEPTILFYPHVTNAFNPGWMPDGKTVYYDDTSVGVGEGVFIQDIASGQRRLAMPIEGYTFVSPSPDGKSFAVYNQPSAEGDPDAGTIVLGVFDLAAGELRRLAEFHGSDRIDVSTAWTPDGKTILFWRKNGDDQQGVSELWAAPVVGGAPRFLGLRTSEAGRTGMLNMHPDGRRIVYRSSNTKREMWKLSNFLDRLSASD